MRSVCLTSTSTQRKRNPIGVYIQRAGWKVAYVPDFEVMHVGGPLSIVSKVKSYRNLVRSHVNRYYFIREHYGGVAVQVFRLVSMGAMVRLLNVVVWLVIPVRRLEAGPKVAAYRKIVQLGVAVHPEDLPEERRAREPKFQLASVRYSVRCTKIPLRSWSRLRREAGYRWLHIISVRRGRVQCACS